MPSLRNGWRIQARVINALMIREISTRFGRENIGFLWLMVEPLLFAGLVAIMWNFMKGSQEHGISITAFVISGYLPLTLFRHGVSRSIWLFKSNGSLMYHRQIKILDFIFVRFFLELIGTVMAFTFIGLALGAFGNFPEPYDLGFMLLGGLYYAFFTFSFCVLLAPLSEVSESIEKLIPVTTYLMIPFSGTFNLVSWVTPKFQDILWYSPPVHAMEMMRFGLFGPAIWPHFDYFYPFISCSIVCAVGLALCRKIRKTLVVE